MPIYEYTCDECDERFEKLVRASTKPEDIVCPKCGSKLVRKVLSVFGIGGGKTSGASHGSSCGPT